MKTKKFFSAVVAAAMIISTVSINAFAAAMPKASITEIDNVTVNGTALDYAVEFTVAEDNSNGAYDDCIVDYEISFDKDTTATLYGTYGSYPWQSTTNAIAFEAGKTYKVVAEGLGMEIPYSYVKNSVGTFKCGLVMENDATVTLNLVMYVDGEAVAMGDAVTYTKAAAMPKAAVTELADLNANGVTLDYGVEFTVAEDNSNGAYDDCIVDYEISFDKDTTATLYGTYGSYPWQSTTNAIAFEAGKTYKVVAEGLGMEIPYSYVKNSVGTFKCGLVMDNAATVTLNLVMYVDGEAVAMGDAVTYTKNEFDTTSDSGYYGVDYQSPSFGVAAFNSKCNFMNGVTKVGFYLYNTADMSGKEVKVDYTDIDAITDGFFHALINNIPVEAFGETFVAMPFAETAEGVVTGDICVLNGINTNKYLGAN